LLSLVDEKKKRKERQLIRKKGDDNTDKIETERE